MAHALSLRPELNTARLQLGLLYVHLNDPDQARQTWLGATLSDDAVSQYLRALTLLLDEKVQDARAAFEAGMEADEPSSPLHQDMLALYHSLEGEEAEEDEKLGAAERYLLSRYDHNVGSNR